MMIHLKKSALKTLAVAMTSGLLALPAVVQADMIGTADIAAAEQTQSQRDELRQLAAREDVAAYLGSKGLSSEAVQARIANLTDAEVAEFHKRLDQMPAGQGDLGVVIAILVIFILLDVAGVTDIFPGL